ncbi:P-loop containing nucleoside triphosphate hydrolase protein [Chaetomium fimeti]|uniref:P-loop containing nucleoside triphosphate hydrolase protein n=1 Tax=Chaetomium fimeti TaxID=1854472 RepID=A0AAE0LM23_9PEZI|nr:P-loop containing nucleoside triphosphate hydrolase protein [Chaetomium fimeti]
MCSNPPSTPARMESPGVDSHDTGDAVPTSNDALVLPGVCDHTSQKRKHTEDPDSIEPETNAKKLCIDAPEKEKRESEEDNKPPATRDEDSRKEGMDEPTEPVNGTNGLELASPRETAPILDPVAPSPSTPEPNHARGLASPPESIPAVVDPVHPFICPPDRNRAEDDKEDKQFASCVVHPDEINTTFSQVHANPDTIRSLRQLTLPLRDAKAFEFGILSRQASSGVLLYGPPGTGKTMLIRALAKESGAKMLAISYADIQDCLVGVAEQNVQRLFRYARRHYPCIIFIDEADSCFRSRSASQTPSYHVDFLNQFLSEMDGIRAKASNKPIVVAATNRPFDIDEGILRRLGRRILVDVPDVRGREAILRLHLDGEKLDPDVDLAEVARHTNDYTGSDLRDLAFEAALDAVEEIHREQGEKAHDGGEGEQRSGADRILCRKNFLRAKKSVAPAAKADLVAKIGEFHARHGSAGKGT